MFFDVDSSAIRPDAVATCTGVTRVLTDADIPEARVTGHTDAIVSDSPNQTLRRARGCCRRGATAGVGYGRDDPAAADGGGAPMRRRRLIAAAALAAVVAAGLVVSRVLPNSAATDVEGDALYAVAVYAAVVLLFARARPAVLGTAAVGWCVAVELFQLTGIPLALAAEFPPIALVLGTGFDARDLLVYPAAVVVAVALDLAVRRRVGMPTPNGWLESA